MRRLWCLILVLLAVLLLPLLVFAIIVVVVAVISEHQTSVIILGWLTRLHQIQRLRRLRLRRTDTVRQLPIVEMPLGLWLTLRLSLLETQQLSLVIVLLIDQFWWWRRRRRWLRRHSHRLQRLRQRLFCNRQLRRQRRHRHRRRWWRWRRRLRLRLRRVIVRGFVSGPGAAGVIIVLSLQSSLQMSDMRFMPATANAA